MLHQVITILSTKGGVGKTTLTANLGGYLSSLGFRVLMVDADFQPALSSYFQVNDKALQGLSAFSGGVCKTSECVSKTTWGDLVISDDSEGLLQSQIVTAADYEKVKQRVDAVRDSYDFILIDTQGAVGALQGAMALAGDVILSPLLVEALAIQELWRGTLALVDGLKHINVSDAMVPPVKVVLWKVDATRDARELEAAIREMAAEPEEAFCVLLSVVRKRVIWRESATKQVPVCALGRPGEKAAAELRAVVCELWPEMGGQS